MQLTRLVRRDDGFTMPLVMGVLFITTLLGVAAFSAARGDISTSAASRDATQAYAAAEAGISWYGSRLAADNGYWAKCTNVPSINGSPAPVNNALAPGAADTRRWRKVALGTTAEYTVELIPAGVDTTQPFTKTCTTATADANMLAGDGTFRIRATGRYNGIKRSIVAKFRRARFLDFLYFTKFETTDPIAYSGSYNGQPLSDYAATYCGDKYRVDRNSLCSEIQFAPGDEIKGPLHSNDSLLICGSPIFGRNSSDDVTTAASEDTRSTGSSSPGWRPACSGTAPRFQGTFRYGQPVIEMPETNDSLRTDTLPSYVFAGTTQIVLNANSTITVWNKGFITAANPTGQKTMAWPTNGLIYVDTRSAAPGSIGCGSTQQPSVQTYTEPDGCANVYVRGTYAKDITIASDKDVIVDGDLKQASGSDAVSGLIADNFVRIYHPVDRTNGNCSTTAGNVTYTPPAGSPLQAPTSVMTTITVQSAILSLVHSFTVDNHDCGTGFGDLVVSGAIAQKYRGVVGTGGSSSGRTGYVKDYTYDNRLLYRNPPFFLTPINAAWRVMQTNEQTPAR